MSVGGPRQRCVLGALLVHLGREVTVDQLIGYLWSDDPPRTARSVIQVQISHLRRALPDCIATTPGGYIMDVDPDSVDLHRFRRLRDTASASEAAAAVGLLDEALDCWRGVPFSGVGSENLDYSVVAPLREERWAAIVEWATCALALGRSTEVVSRLTPLVSEEPFRERLHHLLITALWRDNERARALTAYERFRARLADELGVDPGPELAALHTRILREDSEEEPAAAEPEADTGFRYLVRNDLPRDLPDFTGRQEPLAKLEAAAFSEEGRAQLCVITGGGGEGKTATAVRFGYETAKRFPDGQLFIDLYGYTSNKEPLDPASALGALLRAVGMAPEAVPEQLDERAALWRATLMGRKVLLILDNAASFAQVSPLLASSPGSMTVITTRTELSGLSGARFLSLGMFDEGSSLELFGRVLGEDRVRRETEQAAEIARICGGLPLALRVVAGRMLTRPKWSFAHVARRLGEQNRKLRELRVEGQSVESAIDLSYQSLNQKQRRTFCLLGRIIGNSVDLVGAAALLDMAVEDADDLLQELVGVCLLDEPQGDVYRLHDLIREFASERALEEFSADEVEAARFRLAENYLTTAQHAAELLGPRGHDDGGVRSGYRTDLSGREDAENWFSLHQENLAEAIEYFASGENGDLAWRMADAVWRFYALHGHMALLASSHERVLKISVKQGNRRGQAVTLIGLGIAHYIAGRFEESLELLTDARDLLAAVGDDRGIIRALSNLGMVYERVGRFADSSEAIEGVLDYARALGDRTVEAMQWGNLAVLRLSLGDYEGSIECSEQAILKSAGDDCGEIHALATRAMGEAYVALGELRLGFQKLNEALELCLNLQLVGHQIYVHNSLGTAYRAAGCWDDAVEAHSTSLSLADQHGDHSGDAEILTDLGITYAAAGRLDEAAVELEKAHAIAVERNERYAMARAAFALGRLPEPTMPAARARSLLEDAVQAFTDLGLREAEQAREALRQLGDE
ncbi:BTAD domain-containing putative transcriptional regulator [Nocardiopsis sp. NRRL B-16309]|uniref:AfsR/SARP family transcriptional regulator n=1 Tax=Nocardiopsis sp. NRRL B-16309 TaxID=1519494 RepID=UPI0006ADB006|nr:BTAD domain-containing putative transcriptional regulator [Nocardiopsis sp. NRRL B-16309]KOX13206.1 SARP family transcriptional regulator [Nocardiopsis sp. NRRL B-16309]